MVYPTENNTKQIKDRSADTEGYLENIKEKEIGKVNHKTNTTCTGELRFKIAKYFRLCIYEQTKRTLKHA